MENPIYTCGNCQKIIYLMEPGHGEELKCCDQKMEEMSKEEKEKYLKDKEPYHPKFTEPGAP